MNRPSRKTVIFIITAIILALLIAVVIISSIMLVKADERSHDARILNRAVMETSSIAEALKAADGQLETAGQLMREHKLFDISENTLTFYYDDELQPASQTNSPYKALIEKSDSDGCYSYEITIWEAAADRTIYQLSLKTLKTGGGQ